jgi:hypothetical protein
MGRWTAFTLTSVGEPGKNMRLLGISTNKLSRMLVTLKANTFGTKHLVLKAGCP